MQGDIYCTSDGNTVNFTLTKNADADVFDGIGNNSTQETDPPSSDSSEELVWIPNSGTKYHSNPNCSNMKNPAQVTIEEAINRGYSACKKCY